ncbi:hypothetical protein SVIO_026140 [Streptomyces violaceusniger]|uniref:Uncharacterized protein n=1 Tax=Streptomyces violaceusniger TaxID=68280 RepID=A0A4D4KRP0_STRVO|nr:hypothetical protein SVIO_026140 [Streptomyces violaceusniger]
MRVSTVVEAELSEFDLDLRVEAVKETSGEALSITSGPASAALCSMPC